MADGMLKALDLLDESARAISSRLEPIEVRMRELRREDEEGRKALARAVPGEIYIKFKPVSAITRYKCKMGRAILMLGILSVLIPVKGKGTGGKKPAYKGIQGLQYWRAWPWESRRSSQK